MTPTGAEVESLAADALQWMLANLGPDQDDPDPTLYHGAAGIVVALLDAHAHFGDDRYADAAVTTARWMADEPNGGELSSLYLGLVGRAFALYAVADRLGESWAQSKVEHLLAVVGSRFDGKRWGDQFELIGGNAGIALGALAVGDVDLAVLAVTPICAPPNRPPVVSTGKCGSAPKRASITSLMARSASSPRWPPSVVPPDARTLSTWRCRAQRMS